MQELSLSKIFGLSKPVFSKAFLTYFLEPEEIKISENVSGKSADVISLVAALAIL